MWSAILTAIAALIKRWSEKPPREAELEAALEKSRQALRVYAAPDKTEDSVNDWLHEHETK